MTSGATGRLPPARRCRSACSTTSRSPFSKIGGATATCAATSAADAVGALDNATEQANGALHDAVGTLHGAAAAGGGGDARALGAAGGLGGAGVVHRYRNVEWGPPAPPVQGYCSDHRAALAQLVPSDDARALLGEESAARSALSGAADRAARVRVRRGRAEPQNVDASPGKQLAKNLIAVSHDIRFELLIH